MAMKFRLLLIIFMLLLLPMEPALAQQDPLALSAEGIRLSAHYFLSVPSYSNMADIKAFGWFGGIIFTYQPYAGFSVPR